jgi:Ca2+-binding EF-hand superfamily protein
MVKEATCCSTKLLPQLRYVFEAIDTDRSGELSTQELANYLNQADRATSEDEFIYLFNCMDRDNSGTIDFEEFGELILRHQRLMTEHDAFMTYFVPIDADKNDLLSIEEMNIAMTSVSEPPLTREEIDLLQQRSSHQSFTWNQFIELLLLT